MRSYNIQPLSEDFIAPLRHKIDFLTKPKGSLGRLETLALQIGLIQQTLSPRLENPVNILFGGDHGAIVEGISLSPKEVTRQQMIHFSRGGAGINFLCRQHGFKLVLVDAGVDGDFPAETGIVDKKVRRSTRNYLHESAMTEAEMELALQRGGEVVDSVKAAGSNIVSFGEMGSGNTGASSLWMHLLGGAPLAECVGAGAGLDNAGIRHKLDVLQRAVARTALPSPTTDVARVMAEYGGYEMVMAVGAMLRAAELSMTILVDGFIMSACMLAASKINSELLDYAVFGHVGDESGHRRLLDMMNARPLLALDLRLGEGSGAVCAYPIVDSAVRMINEMDSFDAGRVTKYFD
jgi:nicotinate-nucleotide--dimethylbenzimidazole phosphoribosyltransferase